MCDICVILTSNNVLFVMREEILFTSTTVLNLTILGDTFYKYHSIKLNNFTRAKRNLLTTILKILVVICDAFGSGSKKCYLCK